MLQRYFLIYYFKYFGESALEKIEIIAERIHAHLTSVLRMLASPNVFLRPKLLLISSSFPILSQCDFFLYFSISQFTLFNMNLTLFVSITGLCVRRTSPIYNNKYVLSSKCYEGNISTPCKRGSKLCAGLNSNASFVYQVKLGKQ